MAFGNGGIFWLPGDRGIGVVFVLLSIACGPAWELGASGCSLDPRVRDGDVL